MNIFLAWGNYGSFPKEAFLDDIITEAGMDKVLACENCKDTNNILKKTWYIRSIKTFINKNSVLNLIL